MSSGVARRTIMYRYAAAALRVRGRALLLAVRHPALVDEIRMDVVDILLAQDVVEALHPRLRQHALQHDVPEGCMQTVIEFAQVRGAARSQHMATRTLFGEFDLAGVDLRLGGGFGRRLRKGFLHARRGRG